jgi:hypothetical protein
VSRRRYITSATATDKRLNGIARQSDFIALFYLMMIPHVDDNCLLSADPEELLGTVLPLRRDKQVEDVIAALTTLHEQKLIKWCKTRNLVMFPPKTFYKIQAYIRVDRRVPQEEYDNFNSEPELANFATVRQSSAESVALASASATSSPSATIPIPASATGAQSAPIGGTAEACRREVSYEMGTSGGTPYVKQLREKKFEEWEIREVIDEYNRKPDPPLIKGSIANYLAGMIERNRAAQIRGSPSKRSSRGSMTLQDQAAEEFRELERLEAEGMLPG